MRKLCHVCVAYYGLITALLYLIVLCNLCRSQGAPPPLEARNGCLLSLLSTVRISTDSVRRGEAESRKSRARAMLCGLAIRCENGAPAGLVKNVKTVQHDSKRPCFSWSGNHGEPPIETNSAKQLSLRDKDFLSLWKIVEAYPRRKGAAEAQLSQ